ncbi:zinc-dependent alcohol dehydrogenase [Promicromonospora aerolata]|uniref:Zinc-binding dehydrogenase n=1 Tax=Promicromonospora aerolata TaxID=195749 RepID=A0ABW4V7G5_9MICO
MTTSMQAAVWQRPDAITVEQIPVPEVPVGWALVEVEYTGICGTDLSILHSTHPRAQAGIVPGHESVGVVADGGTTGLAVGDRVVAEPLISCGHCLACRSGSTHVCRNLKLYGIDAPGSLADYVALPASALHVVPAGNDRRRPSRSADHVAEWASRTPKCRVSVGEFKSRVRSGLANQRLTRPDASG